LYNSITAKTFRESIDIVICRYIKINHINLSMKKLIMTAIFSSLALFSFGAYMLIPMDHESQKEHLKAYGIAYWVLEQDVEVYWLLNYRGGSFAMQTAAPMERECKIRNVSYEIISNAEFGRIRQDIANPEVNMEVMKLEKAPKIAVYTPDFSQRGNKIQPWDDAVTMVLTYAEIPYDVVYDREVLEDKLAEYDWLHLHHEDFTGQYGKFYANYHTHQWYKDNKKKMEQLSESLGFAKVSQLKLAVAKKIREYCGAGGFMFAMCSATDTYDIALAAEGLDVCEKMFDGDGSDPDYNKNLDYSQTFAFENFSLKQNPLEYEHSNIDHMPRKVAPSFSYCPCTTGVYGNWHKTYHIAR